MNGLQGPDVLRGISIGFVVVFAISHLCVSARCR